MPLKLVKRKDTPNWWVRGATAGQRIYQTTGTSDRELAEAILNKIETRIRDEAMYGKKAVVTFDEAADSYVISGGSQRYILDVASHRGKTPGRASGLAVHFKGKLLKDITQNNLDDAARKLYPKANNETRNRQCYTPFIAVWNHSVRNGWADVRQWARPRKAKGTNITRLAPRRVGTFPVSYERAAQFIAGMSPAPAMIMTVLFYTGMRPIEVLALRAEHINIDNRWIVVPTSKTGEPRGVPMHEFLVPLFKSLLRRNSLAEDSRIFRTYKGEPYPSVGLGGGGIKSAITNARKRTGIKDISPYTARHTVSTTMVVEGIHPYVKDQILGHAADDMSRHYTNVPQQPMIDAINKLPVPAAWKALPWLDDPLVWSRRLMGNPGRRTDLKKQA